VGNGGIDKPGTALAGDSNNVFVAERCDARMSMDGDGGAIVCLALISAALSMFGGVFTL